MPTDSDRNYTEVMKQFCYEHLRDATHRLHMSKTPIPKFRSRQQKPDMKPHGLWYGVGDSWIDWCLSEMGGWLQPYIYEVVLKPTKILTVANESELEAFEDEYASVPDYMADYARNLPMIPGFDRRVRRSFLTSQIDWTKVSEKYAGIEIAPYIHSKRLESVWYYGWDCASGCVWKGGGVESLRLFAQFDPELGEYRRC
jgi:hypothetical protein